MKTDKEIYIDIKNKLSFTPNVKANHVIIAVHDGVVTLGGVVTKYNEKIEVVKAVRKVRGVKGIANEIKVEGFPQYKRDDIDIVTAAVNALAADVIVPIENIKVTVENGWIILSGYVNWYFEKKNAEWCIKNLYGVHGVINQIQIMSNVKPVDKEVESNSK